MTNGSHQPCTEFELDHLGLDDGGGENLMAGTRLLFWQLMAGRD